MPPISVTIFASDPGTYYLEDDGIPGNNFSRIRFPDGTVVAFEHPTDDLFFDPSVAGITLVIDLVDTLGTSRLSTGDFADPTSTPDFIQVRNVVTAAGVTLVANSAITEFGSDAAPDIVASTLILSSTTGVGTAGNALETSVGVIEAEANTGGINISNFGTVSIGGLTADVDGLDVITSGNLNFTTFGSMVLSDNTGPETVHGGTTSGNVFLTASGVDSDILANVDRDSIAAPNGNIIVTAGRDIGFGLIGTNFDNDVRASGNITFNPGRDLLLDGFADVASDNFGNLTGGDVIVNAGRNITLLTVAGTDAGIEASGTSGGHILLSTGPGGTVTLNSGNGTAPFASLISQTGNVIVNADRLSIGANGAISTVSGTVTLQPRSAGWEVDLGSATDAAFALEISDAELDRIFTSTLTVGSLGSGQLTVSSAMSPLHALNLLLRSGTDIGINASMTVAGALTVLSGDNFFQLPASAINVGGAISVFVDQAGDDGNLGGFGVLNGTSSATAITLSGNADADSLSGTSGANTLNGNGGNDTLIGLGGSDALIGGTGIDTMFGGLGDDGYIVNNTGDIVVETPGEGLDTLYTTVGYALAPVSSIEVFTPYDRFTVNAMNLFGNDQSQTIYGNNGVNLLQGGGGTDTFYGLLGDDSYLVDGLSDQVFETAGQGNDTVYTTATYVLTAGQSIETLSVFDRTTVNALNLSGNNLGQTIYGNDGVNALIGGGGTDTFFGMGGNDGFIVDDISDVVFEFVGGGNDTVYTTASYALGAGSAVETLTVYNRMTTNAINLLGNELGQTIFGNDGVNIIDGKGGADTIFLLDGKDSVRFTTALGGGNVDAVVGFATGADKIQLDHAIFTGLAPGALPAGVLVVGALPADANDRLLYNQVSGALFFDADGNGAGAAILFATFDPGTVLATNDFVVL